MQVARLLEQHLPAMRRHGDRAVGVGNRRRFLEAGARHHIERVVTHSARQRSPLTHLPFEPRPNALVERAVLGHHVSRIIGHPVGRIVVVTCGLGQHVPAVVPPLSVTRADVLLIGRRNYRQLVVRIVTESIDPRQLGRLVKGIKDRIGPPLRNPRLFVVADREIADISSCEIFIADQRRVVGLINIVGVLAVSGQFAPCPIVLRSCGIGHLPQPQGHGITAGIGDGYFRRAVLFGAVFLQIERQCLSHRTARSRRKP